MKWDVLLFAAGHGRRMQPLTLLRAKPSIAVGAETLISRLFRQVSDTKAVSNVYVNCSYKPESIMEALSNKDFLERVKVLWEKEPLGTAQSLAVIGSLSDKDILAVHGDLYLGDGWVESVFEAINGDYEYSYVLTHRRQKKNARSEVIVDRSNVVSIHKLDEEKNTLEGEVSSNSGIYLIRREHLRKIKSNCPDPKEVVEGVLKPLMEARLLKAFPFDGIRYSLESPNDIQALNCLIKNQ